MSGTRSGGQRAAATNMKKYGADFYRDIGRKGGRRGHLGGFAANPELAKVAGAKGGRASRRGKSVRITGVESIYERFAICENRQQLRQARVALLASSTAAGWSDLIEEQYVRFYNALDS